MDDLEWQIAHLPRPEPSAALDARIERLLNRKHSHGTTRRHVAKILAPAVFAAVAGFLLGRQTAPRGTAATVTLRQAPNEARTVPPSAVATMDNQLADLFILPAAREDLFGGGSPRIEASPTIESRRSP